MRSNRRSFLKTTAVAAAAATLMPDRLFAQQKKIQRVGLQLYSVRDEMQKDPVGTLKLLSEMGYRHVGDTPVTSTVSFTVTPLQN